MSTSTQGGLDDRLTVRLEGGPGAASKARRALAGLRADIDPALMETLRLLVTELVTNSVRHARANSLVLKVLVGTSAVWTEVTDEGPGFDPAATGTPLGPVSRRAVGPALGCAPRRRHHQGVVRASARLVGLRA